MMNLLYPGKLEMISETDFVEIDSRVLAGDARIGEMLKAIAEIILLLVAERDAQADMAAELEASSHAEASMHAPTRELIGAYASFRIRIEPP